MFPTWCAVKGVTRVNTDITILIITLCHSKRLGNFLHKRSPGALVKHSHFFMFFQLRPNLFRLIVVVLEPG
jgi:hypothetical protein